MFALGYTPQASLQKASMDWALSGAVKLQDFFYTYAPCDCVFVLIF